MKEKLKTFLLFFKYQIIIQFLIAILIMPIAYYLMNYLISSTGRSSISSGDYIYFLFSFKGIGFLFLSFVLSAILIAVDINIFIILSALVKEKKFNYSIFSMIKISILSIKKLFSPAGILAVTYISILLPLTTIGISISNTKDFQIPKFITSVIFSNPVYTTIYILLLIIIFFIALIHIFLFHYIILKKENIKEALKKSRELISNNKKVFFKEVILRKILNDVIKLITVIIFSLLFIINTRFLQIFTMNLIAEIIYIYSIMLVPETIYILTNFIYKYDNVKYEINIEENKKSKEIIKPIYVLILLFLGNLLLSFYINNNYESLLNINEDIVIIAHRGGGDLATENTILSLQKAVENDIKYSEIDIQRTKDNKYILNHDKTFNRLAGVNKASYEMNYAEIEKIRVENEKVATLDEILDYANDKITLLIELKGITADEKMVDDVIKMLKEKNMLNKTILVSLDYDIIKYIEKNYEYVDTGYIYFFVLGDIENLQGDYLIMEEREATVENIRKIKSIGKKAIVWTVNTESSIEKFVNSNVDGIITDNVLGVKKAMEDRKNKAKIEILFDKILER